MICPTDAWASMRAPHVRIVTRLVSPHHFRSWPTTPKLPHLFINHLAAITPFQCLISLSINHQVLLLILLTPHVMIELTRTISQASPFISFIKFVSPPSSFKLEKITMATCPPNKNPTHSPWLPEHHLVTADPRRYRYHRSRARPPSQRARPTDSDNPRPPATHLRTPHLVAVLVGTAIFDDVAFRCRYLLRPDSPSLAARRRLELKPAGPPPPP